jgi:hypothetical protein
VMDSTPASSGSVAGDDGFASFAHLHRDHDRIDTCAAGSIVSSCRAR